MKEGRETIEFDVGRVAPWRILESVHLEHGLYPEAIHDLEQGLKLQNDSLCPGRLGYAYARARRRSDALMLLQRMVNEHSRSYISPYHIGVVYLGLGDLDQVFSWFDKAYEDRDPDLMMTKVEPLLDGLRTDPRYRALLRRMRLEG